MKQIVVGAVLALISASPALAAQRTVYLSPTGIDKADVRK